MGGRVTCRVWFARAPVLGLCFFVSVYSVYECIQLSFHVSRLRGGVESTLRGAVQGDGPGATAECHGSAMHVASISE